MKRLMMLVLFSLITLSCFAQADFREYNWGTSVEEFKASIKLEYVKDATYKQSELSGFIYLAKVDNYDCTVTFSFENGKLHRGDYSLPDKIDIVNYLAMIDRFRELLTKKYGEPVLTKTTKNPCTIAWKTDRTSITLYYFNGEFGLEYATISYENIADTNDGL